MFGNRARIQRERRTIAAMIACYCGSKHEPEGRLCPDCQELLAYANGRLDRCPFGVDKPTCVQCPIHCYTARQRERIQGVMRFAGPRMLWRHPILALFHLLDGRRPAPALPRPGSAGRTVTNSP